MFCDILFYISGLHSILNVLTKITLIGQVFLKLLTPKDVLIQMHNEACFWRPFGSERVNETQTLLKSAEKYFYPAFLSFWAKLS